jgi:hypothetical protein
LIDVDAATAAWDEALEVPAWRGPPVWVLRNVFRAAVGVDDATWARGRGWALSVGLILLSYYEETNPVLAATGRRLIDEVLAAGGPVANSEVRRAGTFGVLELSLHTDGYDWEFVPEAGSSFTDTGSDTCAGAAPDSQPPAAPTGLTAAVLSSTQIDLS